MPEKISKSRSPKLSLYDVDGAELGLELAGDKKGNLLVSIRNDPDDDTWKCITLSISQLEDLLSEARYMRSAASRLETRIQRAIEASDNDGGSAGDAIQDMLAILRSDEG